jgi:hypothetical protein
VLLKNGDLYTSKYSGKIVELKQEIDDNWFLYYEGMVGPEKTIRLSTEKMIKILEEHYIKYSKN